MNEQAFRTKASESGFAEPTRKEWSPGFQDAFHSHAQDVFLLVLQGELILCLEDGEISYQVGSSCHLAAGTAHTEKTGDQGAVTLVALR